MRLAFAILDVFEELNLTFLALFYELRMITWLLCVLHKRVFGKVDQFNLVVNICTLEHENSKELNEIKSVFEETEAVINALLVVGLSLEFKVW